MKIDWSPLTKNGNFDASLHMVQLFQSHDDVVDPWKMFSYERPACVVWNVIGQHMADKGYTVEQIKDWMQSKNPRWALDGDLGDVLRKTVKEWAEKQSFDE